jgi:hypothetical protein
LVLLVRRVQLVLLVLLVLLVRRVQLVLLVLLAQLAPPAASVRMARSMTPAQCRFHKTKPLQYRSTPLFMPMVCQ